MSTRFAIPAERGGKHLKKTLLFVLSGLFLLAFFLLGRGLISGPETEAQEKTEFAQGQVFFAIQAQGQESQTVPSAQEQRQARGEALRSETEMPIAPVCCRDRNGMPLTGRTWQKTVYLVCPPEGVPG